VNKTGLDGSFVFTLRFQRRDFVRDPESIFGLKLVPRKGMTELLVVDHVERPSAN
jgi:hypothetical protein